MTAQHLPLPYVVRPFSSLRRVALLAALAASAAAQAQPTEPVLFVHGLNSSEMTWAPTFEALEDQGWGPAYAMHFDLNASETTLWSDDVRGTALVDYLQFYHPDRLVEPDSGEVRRAVGTLPGGAPAARHLGGDSRLFAVNFNAFYNEADDTFTIGADRGISGRSESNCSAAAKQGAALNMAIDEVLTFTSADRVILVAHSMGGLAIREYLQRTTASGEPRWWVDSGADGHRVAAAITYGTPHQGSNFADPFGFVCGASSEAYRDIRYTYVSASPAETNPYLYGGAEAGPVAWHNRDYDADGAETGSVQGLNEGDPEVLGATDNPAMPLPEGIRYVYIHSSADGLVTQERQYILDTVNGQTDFAPFGWATGIETQRSHIAQPGDWQTIVQAITDATAVTGESQPTASESLSLWPNPTQTHATVGGTMVGAGSVRLAVVDVMGRRVATVDLGAQPAGPWSATLDTSSLSSGMYAVLVQTGSSQRAVRLTVSR